MRFPLLAFLQNRAGDLDRRLRAETARADRLERTLVGISSCATQCPCCRAHRDLAVRAITEAAALVG